MPWRITVRSGPRVERIAADSLDDALDLAERHARALAADTSAQPIEMVVKTYAPADQVAHRVEVAGPRRFLARVQGGVDVRGDGSLEAFTGRTQRVPVERERGEDAFAALRRAVGP